MGAGESTEEATERAVEGASEDKTRRAALLSHLLIAMALLAVLGCTAGLLETNNEKWTTLAFYGAVFLWLGVAWVMVRRGSVVRAAWGVGVFFWLMVAVSTALFGGMRGQIASNFAVSVLLVGSVIGGRPALVVAAASSLWCGIIAYLELNALLPPQLGVYSPINAWAAVTITVLLTSILIKESLSSLSRVHARAECVAAERDEALRRSIQGQKMELVGNLSGGIAHDFNNLLNVIKSASGTLRDIPGREGGDAQDALNDLDDATSRAVLMTRQLLSLGRPSLGDAEPINLKSMVSHMARMLPRLLGSSITVTVDAVGDAWIRASRAGVEQIVLNLAVNARDAMPLGGELRLSVAQRDEEVALVAADDGEGLAEETQRRMFEPFFSTKSTGTGLGLATVKYQADRASGKIEVASQLGKGTTFTLSFPRCEPPKDRQEAKASLVETKSRMNGRIALVEDDTLVRSALSRILRGAGYEVLPFADGEEAVAFLASARDIVCLVTDLVMPRLDGEALAQRVAEANPQLPIVLMSGNREPDVGLAERSLFRFLAKPVAPKLLLGTIRELARRAHTEAPLSDELAG